MEIREREGERDGKREIERKRKKGTDREGGRKG